MTRHIRSFGLLLGAVLALPAAAQDPNQVGGDTPEPGVARISLLSGDVSVRRGDSGELVAAELNAPLVGKDHLITSAGSRAEIQFDYANMIRVSPDSEVRLGELLDGNYLIQVALGTTTFRVLRDTSALAEISTPTVSVRPLDNGSYRVTVRPDGSTQVTVRSGEAEIFTPTGSELLRAGQTMEARGDAANPEFMISSAIPRDEWDRWNENRDNDLNRSRSYQYVSRDIYGADDLDNYGRWVYDQPYGWVWAPNVAPGWAPYRVGRWINVNYYGWTWLSGDPWGWAPYHYGNWYYAPQWGWCWYPGAIGPRYYWRPALVSFFGWGSRGGFSIGIGVGFNYGYVGWVPLAPFEVYRPWYGRGVRNNITIINNVNIVNNYRNARFINGRNGVTGIEVNNFGRRRTDLNNFARANDRDLQRGGESRGRLPIDASPESRRFNDRQVAQTAPRSNRQDADFVRSPGRARGPEAGTRDAAPVASTAGGRSRSGPASNGASSNRVATPNAATNAAPSRSQIGAPRGAEAAGNSAGTINGGWRRLGDPARAADATPSTNSQLPRVITGSRSRGSAADPAPASDNNPGASNSGALRSRAADATSGAAGQGTVNGGWRRFDQGTRGSANAGSSSGAANGVIRRSAPPSNGTSGASSGGVIRSEPRQQAEPRANGRSRAAEPVRIAPQIVQPRVQRDTGRSTGSNDRSNSVFGSSGGGTIQRAPRAPSAPQPRIQMPTPRMDAPRPSRSAPSAPSMPNIGSRASGASRGSSGGSGGIIMSRPGGGGGGGGDAVRSGGGGPAVRSGGGGGAPRGAVGGGNAGGSGGGRRR